MFQLSPVIIASAFLVRRSAGQYPPPVTYDTVLKSPINPNITISYKTPDPGTCVTAFPDQKQYTGYVNLPPSTLKSIQQNYSINTFFWFVEARESPETAPLTIWLNGGPGSSSMLGLFTESGPCEVVQLQDGSFGTHPRVWGWDRSSNLLFIDQPTKVGFSYDELKNASIDLLNGGAQYGRYEPPRSAPKGTIPWAWLNGTFSSSNILNTQNTSAIAASASWHFLQGFLSAFPQYNPGTRPGSTKRNPTGINLFAESYGGQYGPAFADFFEDQNAKRDSGEIDRDSTLEIELTSLGIVNGIVDELIQAAWWPKFAYENTYGIQAIDQVTELNALSDILGPGGCAEMIAICRTSLTLLDPYGEGDEAETNRVCSAAKQECNSILTEALSTGRSPYDIRVQVPSSYPSPAYMEYLNTPAVQKSIGAKVNYTQNDWDVFWDFFNTGDEVRGSQMQALTKLLQKGIRVALIYGDADMICNWGGGEQVSLELARSLPSYSIAFPAAGYADIVVNKTYVGGQVRQFGNLSFARIYDAGHTVPSYQPETAFTVFTRIIKGTDIGMGKDVDLTTFGTLGPANSDHRNIVPAQPDHICWVRGVGEFCTQDEIARMERGEGFVKNGIWHADEDVQLPLLRSVHAGKPGVPPAVASTPTTTAAIMPPLTGVYTASETPKVTSGASSLRPSWDFLQRAKEPLSPWFQDRYTLTKNEDAAKQRRRANRFKRALKAVAAVLGSLLLVSTIASLALCLLLLRRGRRNEYVTEPESQKQAPVQRTPTLRERFGMSPQQQAPVTRPAGNPPAQNAQAANAPIHPSPMASASPAIQGPSHRSAVPAGHTVPAAEAVPLPTSVHPSGGDGTARPSHYG